MRIKEIEIGRFGKLKDYKLSLGEGFQILYGDNEAGKTTIMNFIYMMFYGGAKPSTINGTINPRQNYLPWDGGEMSGAVVFEHKGTEYRLEKVFKKSKATDTIVLWNNSTNEKEAVPKGSDIGARFFDMTAQAFEKSVFMGNIGISGSDDDISSKLSNLVSSGDETVSHKKIMDRIGEARYDLITKSGRAGKITLLNEEMASLEEERRTAKSHEAERKAVEEGLREIKAGAEALKRRKAECEGILKEQERLREFGTIEVLTELDARIAATETETESGTVALVELKGFADACEALRQDAAGADRIYREKAKEEENKKAENKEAYQEITAEEAAEAVRLDGRISRLKAIISHIDRSLAPEQEEALQAAQELEGNAKTLEDINGKLKELKPACDRYQEIQKEYEEAQKRASGKKNAWEIEKAEQGAYSEVSKERISMSRERLEGCRRRIQQGETAKAAGRIDRNMAVVAAVVAVISIVAGIVIHPYGFAGMAAAALLLAAAFAGKLRAAHKGTADGGICRKEAEEAERKLRSVMEEAEAESCKKAESVKKAEEELQRAEAAVAELKEEIAVLKIAYEEYTVTSNRKALAENSRKGLESNREAYQAKLQEKKRQLLELAADFTEETDIGGFRARKEAELNADGTRLYELLNSKSCIDVEEIRRKHTAWETEKKSREVVKNLKEERDRLFAEFTAKVSQYRPAAGFDDASEILEHLKEQLQVISDLKKEAAGMREALGLKNVSAEELIKIKGEAEGGLKEKDGKIPAPLSEEEMERLQEEQKACSIEMEELGQREKKLHFEQGNLTGKAKNLNEIDDSLKEVERELREKQEYYEALVIAEDTMNEAINELGSTFGPMVNDKTADIFSRLTNGKYNKVRVSKKFDLSALETGGIISRESRFLSNGTVDQAYLSLRLAVAELLARDGVRLPIFLDDVFMQYDDERLRQGLQFLAEYAEGEKEKQQIILFTCHDNIVQWVKENLPEASVKSIQDHTAAV